MVVANKEEARDKVIEILQSAFDWGTCSIEFWGQPHHDDQIGVRVSEVSFYAQTGPNSGFGTSFMQADEPASLAVCAAVERVILDMILFPEDLRDSIKLLILAIQPMDAVTLAQETAKKFTSDPDEPAST